MFYFEPGILKDLKKLERGLKDLKKAGKGIGEVEDTLSGINTGEGRNC